MKSLVYVGACVLGLGLAGALTYMTTEQGYYAAAARRGAAAHEEPAPLPSVPPVDLGDAEAAAVPTVDPVEPALIGFDAGLPEMPKLEAPTVTAKRVRFGVVVVAFSGAQGASNKARSKDEALTLATKLAEQAGTDWKAAVAAGDAESLDDAGKIDRGVLEPEIDTVLFQLEVGQTSPAVLTPRGYWVVKRLE